MNPIGRSAPALFLNDMIKAFGKSTSSYVSVFEVHCPGKAGRYRQPILKIRGVLDSVRPPGRALKREFWAEKTGADTRQ